MHYTKPNQVLQFLCFSADAPDRHCGRADVAAALLALCMLGCSTARSALTDEKCSVLFSLSSIYFEQMNVHAWFKFLKINI